MSFESSHVSIPETVRADQLEPSPEQTLMEQEALDESGACFGNFVIYP